MSEDAERSLPMEYHSLLPENRLTTNHEEDSSSTQSCLKEMWSKFLVNFILWEPVQTTEEHPDRKGFKGGEDNTTKQRGFWKLMYYWLCWLDPLPSENPPKAPPEIPSEDPPRFRPAGIPVAPPPLPNDGNKCYCNSVIQAMSHVKGFHQMLEVPQEIVLISELGYELKVVHQLGPIGTELRDLLCKINPCIMENSATNLYGQRINPRHLLQEINQRNKNNRFDGNSQEDSHEFLRCLLQHIKKEQVQCIINEIKNFTADGLTDELKSEYRQKANKGTTRLEREVGGVYSSTIICRRCFKPVQLEEQFFDLSLSIPDKQGARHCRRETPDLRGREDSPIPAAINVDNTNLTVSNRQEVVTSPLLSPNPCAKNPTVNPKIATDFTALQEYLCNEGFHYHPPSLERPVSTNHLEQSLLDYTGMDVLGDDQPFCCNQCNTDNSLVSKQALIMRLQKVLILHIKRFELNNGWVTKNNDFLSYGLLLDMAPYCTNECLQELKDKQGRILYGLNAVVEHRGRTLSNGHYVAYVRRSITQQAVPPKNLSPSQSWEYDQNAVLMGDWYEANDQNIVKCPTGFAEVSRKNAYLLFYELLPKL